MEMRELLFKLKYEAPRDFTTTQIDIRLFAYNTIKLLQAEIDSLKAEKGMADMGFVSEGAAKKFERLEAENDKLRFVLKSSMETLEGEPK